MAYVIIQGRGLAGLGRAPTAAPPTVTVKPIVPTTKLPVFVPTKTGFTMLLPPKTTESKGPSGTVIAIGVGLLAVVAVVASRGK